MTIESVPQHIHTDFVSILEELSSVYFSIPRYVLKDCDLKYEVHGFSDASESAYGACIYIRTIHNNGTASSRLLCAKSRVAPLKATSLPRLELCAAVMLAQLQAKVNQKIRLRFENVYLYLTQQSTIVLAWIQATSKRWKTFVANRIGDIHQLTSAKNWYHVST